MSAAPSFPDVFLIILIVIPGYISVIIHRKIGGVKRIVSDTVLLYTSLMHSIVIYAISSLYFQLNEYDSLKVELLKPYNIPTVLAITTIVGVIIGLIARAWRKLNNVVPEDSWMSVFDKYQKKYDAIPWIKIAGIRDRLIHQYFGVNYEIIWTIIQEELTDFYINLDKILSSY